MRERAALGWTVEYRALSGFRRAGGRFPNGSVVGLFFKISLFRLTGIC